MAISPNQKPTIYRNLYENTGPGVHPTKNLKIKIILTFSYSIRKVTSILNYLIEMRKISDSHNLIIFSGIGPWPSWDPVESIREILITSRAKYRDPGITGVNMTLTL